MIGTSTEILLWLSSDYRYAPLFGMSRQRLVGLRKRVIDDRMSVEARDAMLERLSKRLEKLTTATFALPPESKERRDIGHDGRQKAYPKPVLLEVPVVQLVRKGMLCPAVVRDHRGRFFHETTFIRMMKDSPLMADLHLEKVMGPLEQGKLIAWETLVEVARRKDWDITAKRIELPSIWEVVQFDYP